MNRALIRTGVLAIGGLFASSAFAQALDCVIQPHQVVALGSPSPGVIESIAVERGDFVRQGQLLVQLRADVERASLGLARVRAQQAGELSAADSAKQYASRELARATELQSKNFVSSTYLDKTRTEAEVALGRANQAAEKRSVAEKEVELAQAQLAQRGVRAPISGVVVERFMSAGEYVDDKPMLRIARIDLLRVDAIVPAAHFGKVQPGAKATVMPEFGNVREVAAVVRNVDRVVDPASNTFRVRLELPNPKGEIAAGLRCKVDLGLPKP